MKRIGKKEFGRRRPKDGGMEWLFLVAAVALILGLAAPVQAAPTGAAMPWDAPLTTILDNLQGTVARILITIAVVLTGLLFAFGEAGGAFKKVFGIAFGGALALGALTFLSALGFVGAAL
jgi:type IV secretion system protein VirB2